VLLEHGTNVDAEDEDVKSYARSCRSLSMPKGKGPLHSVLGRYWEGSESLSM